MNIKDYFNQAICSRPFSTRRNGGSRYVIHQHGPFKTMCYVPKNTQSVVALPKSVSVDKDHADAAQAKAFVLRGNRAVSRAREHGIHVGSE